MLIIRHIKNALPQSSFSAFPIGCVATIGNFDGLHRGHQAIFEQLKKQAKAYGLPCVVITFEPLPREYFFKSLPSESVVPTRLTRFKEKWKLLEAWGIDVLVCLHFDVSLANLSASQFVERILIQTLNIKHLIVGSDFRFGRQREGDLALLQVQAKKSDFTLEIAPIVYWNRLLSKLAYAREIGEDSERTNRQESRFAQNLAESRGPGKGRVKTFVPTRVHEDSSTDSTNNLSAEVEFQKKSNEKRISSSWVREALQADDLLLAEQLLGRPYSLLGKIIHGDKRARQWGVPTANLNIHRSIIPTVLPIKGVYAVTVNGLGSESIPGVANVGSRPTVEGIRSLLEVHLLDFNGVIYDRVIEVNFLHKLRNEKRFDSLELLKQQILQDVEMARVFFKCFKLKK